MHVFPPYVYAGAFFWLTYGFFCDNIAQYAARIGFIKGDG